MSDAERTKRARSIFRRGRRYLAELAIVFVGVWLSLLAEDWRQDRIAERTEKASLERMSQDLAGDLEDLHVNVARASAGVRHGLWLLQEQDAAMNGGDELRLALTALQLCSTFINNPAEFMSLQNSGQLDVIADRALRRSIVERYGRRAFLEFLHQSDCQRGNLVVQTMSPYVVKRPPVDIKPIIGGGGGDGLPDSGSSRISSVSDLEGLLADRIFMNALSDMLSFRRFMLAMIEEEVARTEALKAALQDRIAELD